MSKKEENTPEKKQPPAPVALPSQSEQLCELLGACGVGYECTPGKVALIVGKSANVAGRQDTVATFEHDEGGQIYRVTLG